MMLTTLSWWSGRILNGFDAGVLEGLLSIPPCHVGIFLGLVERFLKVIVAEVESAEFKRDLLECLGPVSIHIHHVVHDCLIGRIDVCSRYVGVIHEVGIVDR